MTNLRDRLAAALAGMPYPARTWQIIAWADYNAVSADTRCALLQLPKRTYRNFGDIMAAVAGQTAAVRCPTA